MAYDPVEQSRQAMQQDQLDRATNSGRYQTGPTDGPHIGLGPIAFGVGMMLVLWIPLQAIGLHAFWSLPLGGLSIFLGSAFANRKSSAGAERSGQRGERPVRFFVMAGAVVCAGFGVWFAVSEGDLPVLQGALTFGGIGAIFGAVLGTVLGLLVRMKRWLGGRGAG